jgi:hypothetical protein
MGWCGGTYVFDKICNMILDQKELSDETKEYMIENLIYILEDLDWDCHQDSYLFNNDIVMNSLKRIHPDWDWVD